MTPIGHEAWLNRWLDAVESGRLHHAWMLYGPSGIGKGTLAKSMASVLLCTSGEGMACGHCHACRMVKAGSHPDFFWLERETGRRDIPVERVRDMLHFLSLSSAEGGRRIAVLDDAHLLNLYGANALLKMLEEPPPNSLVILLTANLLRLPATIRSRCILCKLAPLSEEACRKVLAQMGVGEEEMNFALSLADGRPGRLLPLVKEGTLGVLREWAELVSKLTTADVESLNQWISRHVQRIPHDLIVEALINGVKLALLRTADGGEWGEALLERAWTLASWPERVHRFSLRPDISLFAEVMALRLALKEAARAKGRKCKDTI